MPSFRSRVYKNRTRVDGGSHTRLTLTVKLLGRLGGTGMSAKNGVIPIIPNLPVFLYRRTEWVGLLQARGWAGPHGSECRMGDTAETHHE